MKVGCVSPYYTLTKVIVGGRTVTVEHGIDISVSTVLLDALCVHVDCVNVMLVLKI